MRTTALVCTALAASLGFGPLAQARDGDHGREARQDRREARQERREARQEWRADRREARQEWRAERREAWRDGRAQQRAWAHSRPSQVYAQPRYHVQPPRYNAPRYYSHAPGYYATTPNYAYSGSGRYWRGGYLPYEYRQPRYYVSNWQAYPGLYAPPYGYQWVNTGSDFVLMALATGLIANLLSQ